MQLKIYRYFIGTYGAILLVSLALFYLCLLYTSRCV